MIQIYNNKHLTWDGTTSINHYELFADTVTDLPSDPYYFSSPDKGSYKMAQGSIAWVIDVSEIYMLDSGGTWVLESISGGGGGGGGTTNYNALTNKPSINSVELNGNKTLSDLGIQPVIDSSHKISADLVSTSGTTNQFNMQADWNQATTTAGDYIKNKPTLGTAAATDATAYATAAQGTKADSAIQSVKIGGSALTPDTNKAVNITSIPSSVTATTQSQKDNSTKIATTAYVDKAVDDLPEPMVWTGTITITADTSDTTKCSIVVSKPASATNIKNGFTYKIASIASSPVYTGTLKVGDTLIAAKDAPTVTSTWVGGTDWNIVPSGDEPSGTVMSITASNGLKTASGSAITDTGDIQANLASTTALSGNTIYNVGLNSNGNLAVKVPTVSKTAVGLTPQLPNESSTTKFLRQDGSWEVPAYTTVAEGTSNGTVKVNGADVSVHGLGTAAYTASSAYATSTQGGKADTAVQSAGTGLSKSGTTLNHSNSVTAKTTQGFAQIAYDAQGHITGSTAATTAQADAINSGITSTDVAQITTNKNNISSIYTQNGRSYNILDLNDVALMASSITYSFDNATGSVIASCTSATYKRIVWNLPITNGIKYWMEFDVTSFDSAMMLYPTKTTAASSAPYGQVDITAAGHYSLEFTPDVDTLYLCLYIVTEPAKSNSITIRNFKIIPKSAYDAGFNEFVPYSLSNAALTNSISYLENTGKKNWLKPDTMSGVPSGITIQYESDDSITINGTYSGSEYAYVFLHSFTHEAMRYTLSCNVETKASTFYFYTRDGYMQTTQTLTYTYSDSGTTQIVMRIAPNASFSNKNVKLMIRPSIIADSTYQPYALSNAELTSNISNCQFIASRADYAEHTFTVKRSNTTGRYHYGIFMVGTPSTYGIYKIFYNDANSPASATVEKVLGNSALTYTASITWNGLVGTLTLTGSDRAYGGIRGIWFD